MDICELPVDQAVDFFDKIKLNEKQQDIAKQIFKEIKERLRFMLHVGLGYLTLARSAASSSSMNLSTPATPGRSAAALAACLRMFHS